MKTARRVAFRDISKEVKKEMIKNNHNVFDNYYVTPNYMQLNYAKENVRLNRQLGIHKINK